MKRIWFIVLTTFVVGAATGLLLYHGSQGDFPMGLKALYFSVAPGLVAIPVGVLVLRLSRLLNTRLLWTANTSGRFIVEFIGSFSLITLFGMIILAAVLLLYSGLRLTEVYDTYKESFLRLTVFTTVISLIYSVLSMLTYSFYHYSEGQLKEVKIDRKQLKLQFEALRNQLSPHYLFNSLNTISSLIHKDPEKAENYIRRLADTYSYVLSSKDRRLVNLSDELEFVKSYYYLLRVRYEEGLSMNINIPEELNSLQIPPLTLQILVENAVKHNAFSGDHPLAIQLGVVNQSHLAIKNNKTTQPVDVVSSKIGLKNIRQRYAFFTKEEIQIQDTDNYEVIIPLIIELAS